MGGGKPTVPENLMGTLTSSDYSSAYTLSFIYIRYASYYVNTIEHSFRSVNYIRVIAFSPYTLRVFFYDKMISLLYSTTVKSLSRDVPPHVPENPPCRKI